MESQNFGVLGSGSMQVMSPGGQIVQGLPQVLPAHGAYTQLGTSVHAPLSLPQKRKASSPQDIIMSAQRVHGSPHVLPSHAG